MGDIQSVQSRGIFSQIGNAVSYGFRGLKTIREAFSETLSDRNTNTYSRSLVNPVNNFDPSIEEEIKEEIKDDSAQRFFNGRHRLGQ